MNEGASSISAIIAEDMDGWRLDRALAAIITTMSRERLKALISTGQVTNGTVLTRDPSMKVKCEAVYEVMIPAPRAAENEAQDIDLTIVYEDDHLLVVDKQAGLVVHPAAGNFDGTLVNALLHHCAGRLSGIGGVARPGIVHRIDKDTSGLMVVAKTDRAHEGLAKQFIDHSITRRYHAIISGRLMRDEGTINASLARSTANRKKIAIVEEGRGKHAITHYKLITPLKNAALIECRLETGRTHQIRVHMSSIGHPLLGDPVYGRISQAHRETLGSLDFARQALHATVIGFIHPIDRKNLTFESKMPLDMQRLFTKLSS